MTPIGWVEDDGVQCRRFEATFQVASGTTRTTWKLCEAEDGWNLSDSK